METDDFVVEGPWPRLEGKTCEALIAEQYWHDGRVSEPANVVWLLVENAWHRLTIDCDMAIWSRPGCGPEPYEMTELGGEVRLEDLGHSLGFTGRVIETVVGRSFVAGGIEVQIRFQSGAAVTFRHFEDRTTYYTG